MRICYFLLLVSLLICHAYSFEAKLRSVNRKLAQNLIDEKEQAQNQASDDKSTSGPVKDAPGKQETSEEKLSSTDEDANSSKVTPEQSSKNTPKEPAKEQSVGPSNKKAADEVNTNSIRSLTEKYQMIDKKQFSELCSNKKLNKTPVQTVHLSGENFILILDDHKLAFKFDIDAGSKYYPKLSKLPYRCTLYCEKMANKLSTEYTIKRFKYDTYLIEFLNMKDHQLVAFYMENLTRLEDEDQSKHLIEVLTFTIEDDGCTEPVRNPGLRDNHVDNLVTKNLIKILCNKQLREHFKANNEFLIQERDGEGDSILKVRHAVFFTFPTVQAYNLTGDIAKDTKLQMNNLANKVKNIKNAVQMKVNDREMYITFNDDSMHILQKQETQLVPRPPSYSLQNFYTCPQPLCLDPYFDDLFIVKSCDFDLLFDFLPKASRLLLAFRGDYLYLINKDTLNAPKIEHAIPIDYLFSDLLNRPEIEFKNINAGEYVKKSDVIILFKDDKYILIDPLNKIVNGPFDTAQTFKATATGPDTVYMDGDDLVMIQKKKILKYKWAAPPLTGRRDISLDEYISLREQIHLTDDFKIDAAYRDGDSYYLFTDEDYVEMKASPISGDKIVMKVTSKDFFNNCAESAKMSTKSEKELMDLPSKLQLVYEALVGIEGTIKGRALSFGTDRGEKPEGTTIMSENSTTGQPNRAFNFHSSGTLQFLIIVLVLLNLFMNI